MSWLSESGQGLGAPRRIDGVLAVVVFHGLWGLGLDEDAPRMWLQTTADDEKSGACFKM